jgi:hypothetical protein
MEENVNTDNTKLNDNKTTDKPWLFKLGNPGGGRPKGSLSAITRVKQIFENEPELFEQFIRDYIDDAGNRKHIVEMLDGKPKQNVTLEGGEKPIPLIQINAIPTNNSSSENTTPKETA